MSETGTFRCIYINCYRNLKFFADISKKLKKGHSFWQFKDHNSGAKYENKTNNPICFSSPNCLRTSFLHLKIFNIHFHGVPLWSILVSKNTWILEVKAVRLGFCPARFRKHTHRGKWKNRFYFFYQVEKKFQKLFG